MSAHGLGKLDAVSTNAIRVKSGTTYTAAVRDIVVPIGCGIP